MYKIAVIGDKESILGFSAIGIDIYPAYEESDIKTIIPKLIENNYAIIYITEKIYIKSEETIKKLNKNRDTAIVTIPSLNENNKVGETKIQEMVKKAIGMEIKFKED